MTVAVISVILLFLDINNYLILLFFGFVAFFLYKILRKQLLFISNNRLQEAQIFQKNIFESLNLIKEIKVFNNYNFFYKSFDS
jgi:ABC-type bacteriocin/lantibiotic exporter with double-glycine peptidase domain